MQAVRIDFRVVLLIIAKLLLLIATFFPVNPKSIFGQRSTPQPEKLEIRVGSAAK